MQNFKPLGTLEASNSYNGVVKGMGERKKVEKKRKKKEKYIG